MDRHHDSRRANTALRTVVLNKRLLHRVQLTVGAERLNSDHVATVSLEYKLNAGADGVVLNGTVARTPEKYRARSTIAF
jgi:hypothetical protein